MDSHMAQEPSFRARYGHLRGADFRAEPFLKSHPEYAWQAPFLCDMKAGPRTLACAGELPDRDGNCPPRSHRPDITRCLRHPPRAAVIRGPPELVPFGRWIAKLLGRKPRSISLGF